MARKKTAAPAATHVPATDAFWIDPSELRLGYNSRIKAEVDEKENDILGAVDLYVGQQQACVARKLPDGGIELVAGFGRYRKVQLIRAGFDHNGARYHDPERKLLVRVDESITGDREAFIASVRENVRKEVSPLNRALQQEVLRKDFKVTDGEIAALYGYNNTNAIARGKKLIAAPEVVQELVHSGELSLDAALKLLELPKAKWEALLASGQKLTATLIGEAIAAHNEEVAAKKAAKAAATEQGEGDEGEGVSGGETEVKAVARNAAAFKKWAAAYVLSRKDELDYSEDAPVTVEFVKGIVDFLNGEGKDLRLFNRFEKLVNIECPQTK